MCYRFIILLILVFTLIQASYCIPVKAAIMEAMPDEDKMEVRLENKGGNIWANISVYNLHDDVELVVENLRHNNDHFKLNVYLMTEENGGMYDDSGKKRTKSVNLGPLKRGQYWLNFYWLEYYYKYSYSFNVPILEAEPNFILDWTPTITKAPTPTPIRSVKCDINSDGVINMVDIISIARFFKSIKGDGRYKSMFDINEDGSINMSDIILVSVYFNNVVSHDKIPR